MTVAAGAGSAEAGGLVVGFADACDGLAEEGDVVGAVLAEAGFGAEAEVVYSGGVDLHDLRAYGVGGDGVGAGDDDVGFDGGAGVLVALGPDEAVDDGELGAEDGGEVAEPLVEIAVHELLVGEDGAHEVLDAEGDVGHAVALELGDADEAVGLQHGAREKHLVE